MREKDVVPSLLSLAPSFGQGSMIATNHGRMDLRSLNHGFNIKAAVQQWYLQIGSKSGYNPLDASPYGNLCPLYWTFLIKDK